ncbi:MAG: phospholipid carrier-dependent glycosyltransferase [Chloroflexi bacterium]|nr:phospholipid carrier-dependent glycosyltransferase [Chloroflexota bacterium]
MTALFAYSKLNRPLTLLLIVFCALALFYSIIVPIFEGPDEDDHFRYAKFIADQHTFPVQLFEPGGGVAGHQGWQPPLYYTLAALIISPIDTSDFSQQLARNYASTFVGDPACCGRNLYYHPDSQNFPYRGTTLAVHLARLLSIFFGAVTVLATYLIADTVFHQADASHITYHASRIFPALAVASVVAFNPTFLFASALVSNDSPLAAFSTLTLLMWVKLLNGSSAPTLRSAALLGALIGLGLLVKTTALGLIPFSILVILVVAWRKPGWEFALTGNVVMLAISALISGGWFVRNWMLYGDPIAYRLMTTSAIFPRSGPLTPDELFQISLPWLWQTFWGGPTPGDFSTVLLALLGILCLVSVVGLVIFSIRNSEFGIRNSILVLGAWLAFILIAQIQFIQTTTGADQGRYLFPAIATIALFFALGLYSFAFYVLRNPQPAARLLSVICSFIICSFFVLALFVPFAYTLPAYARPSLFSENDLARVSHPMQVNFANQLELRGYDLDGRSVKPGDTLRVTLYWRALAPMSESYRIFIHLIGQNDRIAGGADVIPARGAFPTLYWKPGDLLRDEVNIPVTANAMPGKYSIEVGLYPVGKPNDRLATAMGDDRALIEGIKVTSREAIAFNPRNRIMATFADQIDLSGYDVALDQSVLRLTLYWRARTTIDTDYQVFVHALDANGKIIAQADQSPQAGNYPTSIWDAGDQVRDEYTLMVKPGTQAQRIAIGLYRVDTLERLPVSGDGAVQDHVEFALRLAGILP